MRPGLLLMVALGTPLTLACGDSKSPGTPPTVIDASMEPNGFEKAALLAAFADCAVDRSTEFAGLAATLRDATAAYAADRSEAHAIAARDAWTVAMTSWEQAELFSFGPNAPSSEAGGQDLRDNIYGWPLLSRCKIEEQIVSQAYAAPGFGTSLVNGRSLAALDYLLFYTGSDNACSQFSVINADGTWAALTEDERAQRKADYAKAVAADVAVHAAALAKAWDPAQDDFRQQLATAGAGSTVYASAQAGLNAVSNALFYLDLYTKDAKVAKPLGLMDCATATCPESVESPFSHRSGAHLAANLVGLERLMRGCGVDGEGLGFDDWLIAVGAEELAARVETTVAEAQAAAEALGPSVEAALATDLAKVQTMHAKLKAITDILKTEFVSVLNLELPKSVESDND